MADFKYIKTTQAGFPEFIIFSATIKHAEFKHCNPVSAGFVQFTQSDEGVSAVCFGESTTLELKAAPEDSQLLTSKIQSFF